MDTKDRSKIGKASKLKGKYYEGKSCDFWSKNQGVKIIKTAGSGSMIGLPGDIQCMGECVLKDFVIDVKAEKGLLTKKVLDYYEKNRLDAEGKLNFLEIYDFSKDRMHPESYILIKRSYMGRIMEELNGYRKEFRS